MIIQVCEDKQTAIAAVVEAIHAQVKHKPDSVLGLATGGTYIEVYEKLIQKCMKDPIDFSKVITFNLDEYYPIASSHPQSYHEYMKALLFKHLNFNPKNLHLLDGEAPDAKRACLEYEQKIMDCGGMDLQLLGIGRNGHIGFNEPSEVLSLKTHLVTLDPVTRQDNSRYFEEDEPIPEFALTMGMGTIMSSKRILLLATDTNKAGALHQLISGQLTTGCPATLLQLHANASLILDQLTYDCVKALYNSKTL